MNLTNGCNHQYFCELTNELDLLCFLEKKSSLYTHYLLIEDKIKGREFKIRLLGKTTGTVLIDDDFNIIEIKIDEKYIGEGYFYQKNTNKTLKKYIKTKIEY